MSGAAEKDVEALFGSFFAHGRVGLAPVVFGLGAGGSGDHGDRFGETLQDFRFAGTRRLGEFEVSVSDISRSRDLRADVIVEISGEMEHQMSEAVAERKRLAPELFIAQRIGEFADFAAQFFVTSCESSSDGLVQQVSPTITLANPILFDAAIGTYAAFRSTSAEFFEPNAMQLHTACSMAAVRPAFGT